MSRHRHSKHPTKVPSTTQSTLDTKGKVVKPFKVTDFRPYALFILLTVILFSIFQQFDAEEANRAFVKFVVSNNPGPPRGGGLEGQAALGAKKRGAPKSGGREKKNRN